MKLKAFIASALLIGATTANASEYAMAPMNLTAEAGTTANLAINMTNGDLEVISFQLDLYLPEGVTVAQDAYGTPIATLAPDRVSDHLINAAVQTDKAVRYLSYSNNNRAYLGTDGLILTTPLELNLDPGTYTVTVRNASLTHAEDYVEYFPPEATATLTVTAPEEKRYGDNQLYAKDLVINEGEDADLLIGYNSSSEVYEYRAEITLPAGVDVTAVEFQNAVNVNKYENEWSYADGILSLSGAQGRKGDLALAGDYVIAKVSLATASLAPGEYSVTVGSQYLSNDDDDFSPEDYTSKLTVVGTTIAEEPCETPEISIDAEGNLVVTCDTPGAQLHTTVACDDIDTFHHASGEPVAMTGRYLITSYATADGHSQSEAAKAMLVWSKAADSETGVDTIEAGTERALLVRSAGDNVEIFGTMEGELVSLYSLAGVSIYTGSCTAGVTIVPVALSHGEIYVISVGKNAFKYRF